MKRLGPLLIGFFLLGANASELSSEEPSAFAPKFVDMKSYEDVSTSELAKRFAGMDVVFLGEEHDSDGAHQLQLSIIQELIAQKVNIAISLEMFERDVQGTVNEYLAGRIDETMFLASSRPWKNYPEHYKPVLELAREKKLPVIAGNVPREIASTVSKGDTPSSLQSPFFARVTTAPEDLYWEQFVDAMKGHGGMDVSDASKKFYKSQCLKDDTMAESITDFLASHNHRPVVVVHLCGKFHSDFGLGTVARVMDRKGTARVAIVSTERVEALKDLDLKKAKDRCHFMMVVPPNQSKEEAKSESK